MEKVCVCLENLGLVAGEIGDRGLVLLGFASWNLFFTSFVAVS